MVATLEALLKLRDEMTGPLRNADRQLGQMGGPSGGMGSLGKTALATAGGFIAAQGGVATFSKGLSASVGAALKYESQMAQIRALTGATKTDTDELTGAIFDMTKTLPKSPAELGAGAYFVLSSGITDAGDAADVLEIAAKASTVGLGETSVVADALTTVLNAYGLKASDAGRQTDILMQAVKDGKAEASGFSGVLGTVVPIAAQMGVSFEQVAANLATFTRLGVSADEAATGLRGVLNALLKPTAEGTELLAQYGMTMDEVRKSVRERGLAATLQDLIAKFGGNEEALSKLFPEVRGLTNVLATAGVQGDAYIEILGNMDTATGNLDRGFKEVSDTAEFKLKKAMNDVNVELQLLGVEVLPAIPPALQVVREAIELTFEPITQTIKNVKDLGTYYNLLGSEAKEAGIGVVELQSITMDMINTGSDLAGVVGTVVGPVEGVADAVGDLGGAAEETKEKVSDLFKDFQKGARDTIADLLPTRQELDLLAESSADNAEAVADWESHLNDLRAELAPLQDELSQATDPEDVERLTKRISDLQAEMAKTPENIPPILSGFDAWRQRLSDTAGDYATFKDNMQIIMDALVSQNAVGVGEIMAVIREQGPTFAADFAQWFRDDPIAAATTLKEIMPGIMGEAAHNAIQNVLAETSRFNEAWQRDVIDALNALPEEKKVAITSNIDPQFWLLSASLAAMEPGLNIPLTLEDLFQAGQIPRQMGGPVERGVAYVVGEGGRELFIPQVAGQIIPNQALGPAGGGGGTWTGGAITVNVYPREGQSERAIAEEVIGRLKEEYRRGGPW